MSHEDLGFQIGGAVATRFHQSFCGIQSKRSSQFTDSLSLPPIRIVRIQRVSQLSKTACAQTDVFDSSPKNLIQIAGNNVPGEIYIRPLHASEKRSMVKYAYRPFPALNFIRLRVYFKKVVDAF